MHETAIPRPLVVTIGMLKGGAGKTTSAVFAATRYAEQGLAVTVLDGDQTSQSAHDWARLAAAAGDPLPFEVVRFPFVDDVAREIAERRASGKADVVIVDAGGGSALYLEEAASESDALLMPLAPSGADTRRIQATMVAAERGAARNPRGLVAFLCLVRADARTSQPRRWRKQLETDGHPLLDCSIGDRVLYSDAYGTWPESVGEYDAVLAEVEAELEPAVVPA